MPNGKIKWFNEKKGFGFIKPDDDDKDIFVHVSAFEKAGIEFLNEGDASPDVAKHFLIFE